ADHFDLGTGVFSSLGHGRVLIRELNSLAERVAIGPQLFRQHFVDDRHGRRGLMHRFGHGESAAAQKPHADSLEIIGADYFKTVGVRLLRGRTFTMAEAMHQTTPAVAIIDEVLAKKLWPDGDALGQ